MPKRPERPDLVTFLRSLDGRVRQVERHRHPVSEDEAALSPNLYFERFTASRTVGDPTFPVPSGVPTDIPLLRAAFDNSEGAEPVASTVRNAGQLFEWDSAAPTRVIAKRRVATVVQTNINFSFTVPATTVHTYTFFLIVSLGGALSIDQQLRYDFPRTALIFPMSGGVILQPNDYYFIRLTHLAGATANVTGADIRITSWVMP